MCGISLVCEFGASRAALDRVAAMHARVAHRGPDGEGWLAVDPDWNATVAPTEDALRQALGGRHVRIAAAFRWLRIQDPHPSSCQPMGTTSGETWVLFNGEVYNHRALRDELRSHGHTFRTNSDTEVLLIAYEQWGTGCFERLNGMWGAAIVDTRRRTVTVSRDRFGIRPLCYRLDAERLLVGSEAKQVAWLPGERPIVNREAVHGFLAGRRAPAADTYFAGVHVAPAATWATIALDGTAPASLAFTPYWGLSPDGAAAPLSLAAASVRLEELLQDAMALQSVAAVPVGALLSGGLDSSVISSFLVEARRRLGQPSWLVSVTQDATSLDERPYMRAVAQLLAGDDVTAVESPLDAPWVEAWMDKTTWHQEEPLAGVALIAQSRAYHAAAAQGLRVVLEGTGSDELFAGYPRHQMARMREYVGRRRWLTGARELAAAWRRDPAFRTWLHDTARASIRRRARRAANGRPAWLQAGPSLAGAPAERGTANAHAATNGSSPSAVHGPHDGLSTLGRMSFADVTRGNVPAVLTIADRNAMAHSVESRVPYLDHRVVEFGFRLPDDFKTSRGDRKIVLRDVARRRLPALVTERRARIGFGMPIADWMRRSLRPAIVDMMHAPEVTQSDMLDAAGTQRFVTEFLDGRHEDVAAVWRIYALTRWLRLYEAAV